MSWNAGLRVGSGVAGLLVVIGVLVTSWGGVVHGHPAYLVALLLTGVASAVVITTALVSARRGTPGPRGWRLVGLIACLVVGMGWLAALGWARPHTATDQAVLHLRSDDTVLVSESPTRIVLTPVGDASATGVVFLPGALVDARAYAGALRPIAEAGHPVVVVKQPFGIAFLGMGSLDSARSAVPGVTGWVVAGHSLGGTVASLIAEGADDDDVAPATGLLLWASYPAGDSSDSLGVPVLSLSGAQDGLATPAKIEASRGNLPPDAEFVELAGVSHAQFGAYGPQAGDGSPSVPDAEAAEAITAASLRFVQSVAH